MKASFFLLFQLTFNSSVHKISTTTDIVTTNHSVTNGETIVSSGGTFKMRFSVPEVTQSNILGYGKSKFLLCWPLSQQRKTTHKYIFKPGILALLNDKNAIIWSTNTSRPVQNPVALLLDFGNLPLMDANDANPEKNPLAELQYFNWYVLV